MLRTIKRPPRVAPRLAHSILACRRGFATGTPKESKNRDDKDEPSKPTSTNNPHLIHSTEKDVTDTQAGSSTPTPLPVDIEQIRDRLRTWSVRRASALRERMDEFSAAAQTAFQQIGGRMNAVTGYSEIELLKKLVAENERKMNAIREEAKASKAAYEEAVARRSNSQRETNELLQRKSTWTDADVLRFTQLVRADHVHEQDEARAQARAKEADDATERQFAELMRAILARYHEEQVWSDKIRSASTYGSLAALGLNLLVFVLAIVLVEPWKRKRLVQSFERRVVELNEANQRVVEEGLRELREHQERQEEVLMQIKDAQASTKDPEMAARREWGGVDVENVSAAVPGMEFERNAKTARDRQLYVLSAAGALGAGIVGFLLGSWFN